MQHSLRIYKHIITIFVQKLNNVLDTCTFMHGSCVNPE